MLRLSPEMFGESMQKNIRTLKGAHQLVGCESLVNALLIGSFQAWVLMYQPDSQLTS